MTGIKFHCGDKEEASEKKLELVILLLRICNCTVEIKQIAPYGTLCAVNTINLHDLL